MPWLDPGVAASFFVAATLLALAPGPDNLFVLANATSHGARAGLVLTLGFCSGCVVHTAVVALGVAALIVTTPLAWLAIRLFGAGYLGWLAWQTLRSHGPSSPGAAPQRTARALYLRGLIMNVSNPKVTMFFLALLPQFVDFERGRAALQFAQLGALFILVTVLVFGGIALLAGALAASLRARPATAIWLDRLAGVVFAGLALHVLGSILLETRGGLPG